MMTTLDLHPEFLSVNGRPHFAVLPYGEFLALKEWLEDQEDLRDLNEAIKENQDQPSYSLEEVKEQLGIDQ